MNLKVYSLLNLFDPDLKMLLYHKNFRSNLVNVDEVKRKKFKKKGGSRNVGTVDRYKFENADGSITWGYKNEDGSFKVILKFAAF